MDIEDKIHALNESIASNGIFRAALQIHGRLREPGASDALIRAMVELAAGLACEHYGREKAPEIISDIVNRQLIEADRHEGRGPR